MNNKRKQISLSADAAKLMLTDTDGKWTFSGYASVYGSINCYGFAIAKGAYDALLDAGEKPAMFFNHNSRSVPIGKWTSVESDDYGLKVTGELSQKIRMASDVHAALVEGLISGLSVSVGWYGEDEQMLSDGTLVVNKLACLPEISLVTFPADPAARISEALSADEIDDGIAGIKTVTDFEDFLRDAAKLSRRQAKTLVAATKAALAAESKRDACDSEERAALDRLQKAISNLS